MTQPNIDFTRQDLYRLRLKPFVERRMAKAESVFLEKHNPSEWIEYVVSTLMERLPMEKLLTLSDEDLKGVVGRLMSLELVTGLLDDFTPEQTRIFNECLVRR